MTHLKKAFSKSFPAFLGYFPLGFSFGIVAYKTLNSVWPGPLMSLLVYAGAAQYICLTLIAGQVDLYTVSAATFAVNLRHVFYGFSFLEIFKKWNLKKLYFIFGITDETYAILTLETKKEIKKYAFLVTLFTHCYWVLGTIIGTLSALSIDYNFEAFEFILTSLFIVLTLEQYFKQKNVLIFAPSFIAIVTSILFLNNSLILTFLINILLTLLTYKRGKA
tara:strand:+ start:254 stop:913 length:660 start_codon:yes stop_codon:yes gene_type:complete